MTHTTENPLSLADCLAYADETKELILKKDALLEIPALVRGYFKFNSACLVCDENTHRAAGEKVQSILLDSGATISGVHIFPGSPRLHADYNHVVFLKQWVSSLPAFPDLIPVVAGSGTLNDLVKRACEELKLPYLCVPTAASVDGYTPNGAALLLDGFKQTLPCSAPIALAADAEIISHAPAWLSSSGFGDFASKIIAGTDWILADKAGSLGVSEAPAINPVAWKMVQNGLIESLKKSASAARGDSDAVSTLFQCLAITGFAMQYMKSSRPVSGSEHLWSHIWEMEDLHFNGQPVTHGHKVTIGTLAATAFTEIFFADPKGPPSPSNAYKRPSRDERKAEVEKAFSGSRALDRVLKASMDKLMDEQKAETVNQAFRDSWKEIRERVLDRLLPYAELKKLLTSAECPTQGEEIGISRNEAILTARRAQMIRNRYGILDLAWDMGTFELVLKKMEESPSYLR